MSYYEHIIVSSLAERYYTEFIRTLENTKVDLRKVGINLNDALPNVFQDLTKTSMQAVYSYDMKQILFVFEKKKTAEFNFKGVIGNVFQDYGNIFRVVEDPDREVTFTGGKIDLGTVQKKLEYAQVFGYSRFLYRLDSIQDYIVSLAKHSLDVHRFSTITAYMQYLDSIKIRMEELFFDESVGELEIDNFIEEHPIILEQGLDLVKPNYQVTLSNVLNKYKHDLKPDLIAYNVRNKIWTVVDYKRAKRNIIKNVGEVRTGFRAEVHDLQNQLRDYIEYFDEREHRSYVNKQYHLLIEHPVALGIIGNVNSNEQNDFNRLTKDHPKWFDVVPYNYLYDNFCRYVEIAKALTNS